MEINFENRDMYNVEIILCKIGNVYVSFLFWELFVRNFKVYMGFFVIFYIL